MMIGRLSARLLPLVLLLAVWVVSAPASAHDVVVSRNNTVLRANPVADALVEWKVNSGFTLSVLERRGEWLRVRSGQLLTSDRQLWVRADQVAALPSAPAVPQSVGPETDKPLYYEVQISGDPELMFKMICLVETEGRIRVDQRFNAPPRSYAYDAEALSCNVWKKRRANMEVTLVAVYPTRQRIIGAASPLNYPATVLARTDGSWGSETVVGADGAFVRLPEE